MNILIVSSWLPFPPDNGSRLRAYHLLRQLSRRHSLTLLAFGAPQERRDLDALRALCSVVEIIPPQALDRRRLGKRGLLSSVPRHLVQNHSSLMDDAAARHIADKDIAIGFQLDAARYLLPVGGVPRVFEEAEVTVLLEQYLGEPQMLRRARHALTWWKFQRYIRQIVNHFDAVTVVSAREREQLVAMGCQAARVHVVPNGVDLSSSKRPPHRARRLVYPGSVTYSANLDAVRYFVKEILPLIRRRDPEIEFWVTGSTDDIDITDLTASGVTFTGWLRDVDSLVAESTACVVPLRIGGGTRLKVLQAMSLRTPVVSTSKGVEGLAVRPERHFLVADTATAFASQVLRLFTDPLLSDRLTGAAFQVVRSHYSWTGCGHALECAIEAATVRHRKLTSLTTTGQAALV